MFECMPYVAMVVGSQCRGSEYVRRAPMQVRCLVACVQGYPCSMSNSGECWWVLLYAHTHR